MDERTLEQYVAECEAEAAEDAAREDSFHALYEQDREDVRAEDLHLEESLEKWREEREARS